MMEFLHWEGLIPFQRHDVKVQHDDSDVEPAYGLYIISRDYHCMEESSKGSPECNFEDISSSTYILYFESLSRNDINSIRKLNLVGDPPIEYRAKFVVNHRE